MTFQNDGHAQLAHGQDPMARGQSAAPPTEDLITLWLGHARNLTDHHAAQLRDDEQYRSEWCEREGLGFSVAQTQPELNEGEEWSGRMDLNHRPPGPEPGSRWTLKPCRCRTYAHNLLQNPPPVVPLVPQGSPDDLTTVDVVRDVACRE